MIKSPKSLPKFSFFFPKNIPFFLSCTDDVLNVVVFYYVNFSKQQVGAQNCFESQELFHIERIDRTVFLTELMNGSQWNVKYHSIVAHIYGNVKAESQAAAAFMQIWHPPQSTERRLPRAVNRIQFQTSCQCQSRLLGCALRHSPQIKTDLHAVNN